MGAGIGLLGILIVTALVGFYYFSNTVQAPTDGGATSTSQSIIETGLEAKQKAVDVKDLLEKQNQNIDPSLLQ